MSGNEAKAVQLLQEHKVRAKNDGRIHEAYEIEMLLVEMLIYKVFNLIQLIDLINLDFPFSATIYCKAKKRMFVIIVPDPNSRRMLILNCIVT